jgi:hypothetical protein
LSQSYSLYEEPTHASVVVLANFMYVAKV